MSAINLITGLIGSALISVFLLYYILSVGSVPLTIIMVAILIMVGRTVYDEVTKKRNNHRRP